ncbi:MAG: LamG-like jellyroll fold domain-containing protein [Armatimonadota bacterium]
MKRQLLYMVWCFACLTFLSGIVWADTPQITLGDVTFYSTGEGALQSTVRGGTTGWHTNNIMYANYANNATSGNLSLTFTVHDGGYAGSMPVSYDSVDETSHMYSQSPGVWKQTSLQLTGANQWRQVTMALPDARTHGTGCNGMNFRLEMGNAQSVYISNVSITSTPVASPMSATQDDLTLSSSEMQLTFGLRGLRNIHDVLNNRELMCTVYESPLFVLKVKAVGNATPVYRYAGDQGVTLINRSLNGNQYTAHYHLTNNPGSGMEVTCTVTLAGAQSTWGLTIDNQSTGYEVCGAQYPIIKGARISADGSGDTLIGNACWEQLYRNPASRNSSIDISQANRAIGLRWTALYDDIGGLYLGDHNFPVHDLLLQSFPDVATTVRLSLQREFLVAPDTQVDAPNYVLALTSGDWHAGADLYRDWASAQFTSPSNPDWLLRVDGWGYGDSNNFTSRGYSLLNRDLDRARARGLGNLLAMNRQMIEGPANYYCGVTWPTYSPVLGSATELADILRDNHERGGHEHVYFNWQLWNPHGEINRQRIRSVIPRSWVEEGPSWIDEMNWYTNTVLQDYVWNSSPSMGDDTTEVSMDVGTANWQQYLLNGTTNWVQNLGVDGIYFDQLSASNNRSGSLGNTYNDYGVWTRASESTLADITTQMRTLDPHFTTSGESCNDFIGQAVNLHMTSGVWNRLELFRYCMPWQIVIDGKWNLGSVSNKRWRYIWMTGARFEGLDETAYCNSLLKLRQQLSPLIYQAYFQDTVGLTLKQNGVTIANPPRTLTQGGEVAPEDGPQAKWFKLADPNQGAIINVIQESGAAYAATISVPTSGFSPVTAAWAVHPDGTVSVISGNETSGVYTCTVPLETATHDPNGTNATSIVLVGEVSPQVIRLELPFAAVGNLTTTGAATIANYGAAAASGSLSWQVPSGWAGNMATFTCAAGGTVTVPVSVTLPASVPQTRSDLMLQCTAGGVTTSYPHWVSGCSNNLGLRLFRDFDGEIAATVSNHTGNTISDSVTFTPPQGVTLSSNSQSFSVAPWSDTVVRVKASGLEALGTPVHLTASVPTNTSRSLLLNCPVPNPSFEADTAGDGVPDYWSVFKEPGDVQGLDANGNLLISRVSGGVSGSYCLQLNPAPLGGDDTHYALACTMVNAWDSPPNNQYQFSAYVKKTSGDKMTITFPDNTTYDCTSIGTTWTQVTRTFSMPTDSMGGLMTLRLNNYGTNAVWCDNIQVTRSQQGTLSPTVNLTAPVNQQVVLNNHHPITLAATATDPNAGGSISQVQFYLDGTTLLGTDTTAPYTCAWTPTKGGFYQITAVATNNAGRTTTSPMVSVSVNDSASAWWQFDETSGSTAADSSGHSNTGTPCYGADWTTGINGGALSFNGLNSRVTVPDVEALKYRGGNLAISCWININSTETSGANLLSKAWNDSGNYNYWLHIDSANKLSFSLQIGCSGETGIEAPTALAAATWYHVVATVDRQKHITLTVYNTNGTVVTSAIGMHTITDWTPPYPESAGGLAIGTIYPYDPGWNWGGSAVWTFDGKIDDMQITNTPVEGAWWQFNEGSGSTAVDSTGTGNTGTLYSEAAWTTGFDGGRALSFNGLNSRVNVPDVEALKYRGGDLAISCWISIDSTETSGAYLLSKVWNSSGNYNYWLYLDSTNKLSLTLQDGAGSIQAPTALASATWYRVVAMVDRQKNMKLTVYNTSGTVVTSATGVHTITNWAPAYGESEGGLVIGTLYPYPPEYYWENAAWTFDGKIDDMQINITPVEDAWWQFNEGSGTTAADSSGNGNTGTLCYGAAWTTGHPWSGDDAVSFTGLKSRVIVPDVEALKYRGGDLAISCWVNINTTETSGAFLLSKPWNGSGNYNYWLYLDSTRKLSLILQEGAGSITAPTALASGTWYLVKATADAQKNMKLSVYDTNGTVVTSATGVHAITNWTPAYGETDGGLAIGTIYPYPTWYDWGGSTAWTFDGKIDDLKINIIPLP